MESSSAGEVVSCTDASGAGPDSVFAAPELRNRKPGSAGGRAEEEEDILEVEFKDEEQDR